MKIFLFPRSFQTTGWIIFIPSLIIGALLFFEKLSLSGITEIVMNDIVIVGIAIGALFIVCSKERIEDEMTMSIRLSSLLKSLYVYVILLVICTLLINGINFLAFAFVNLVLFPIIFVCNFRLEMHRYNMICEDEKQD